MKIFLIGMPGAGKSTLGKELAAALRVPFVDLDTRITEREGNSIAGIFETYGEAYFREVERDELRRATREIPEFVLATGGGTPCYHQGMEWMNKSGITLFLEVPLEVLLQRTRGKNSRPLLTGKDPEIRLRELWQVREPVYRQARFTFTSPSVSSVLECLNKENQG